MSDNTAERDALIQEVAEKVRVLGGDGVTPAQEQWIKDYVKVEAEARADSRKPTAEPERVTDESKLLDGTVYKRMGMTMGDVELAHDLMTSAARKDSNIPGPNAATRKIVETARKSRAMDTAESGFGSQLVPDAEYIPQIWESAREDYGRIVGLVEQRTMTGPVEKHPVLGNVPKMILAAQTTDNVAAATAYGTQKVGSQEVTLTAFKLLTHYNYSGEMAEDSVVPFVPLLRRACAIAAADTADSIILNGDTTNAGTGNINLDDANPADTLHYLAADGARMAAITDNTGNWYAPSGNLTYEQLIYLPTLMIDRTYGTHWGRPADPNKLVYVITPELDNDVLGLSEITNMYANIGQLPPTYPPLNGELCRIGKHPMISTINMGLTEADGRISTTGTNNTKGQVLCFNSDGMLWGIKRSVSIEVERYARFDMWAIVMSMRCALGRFTPTGAASGIEWASVLGNVTNA
jgi:HK97 family phage major capsid protein